MGRGSRSGRAAPADRGVPLGAAVGPRSAAGGRGSFERTRRGAPPAHGAGSTCADLEEDLCDGVSGEAAPDNDVAAALFHRDRALGPLGATPPAAGAAEFGRDT